MLPFDRTTPPSSRAADQARPTAAARQSLVALVALAAGALCGACAPWSASAPLAQAASQPIASAPSAAASPQPPQAEAERTWAAIQDRIASTPPEQWPALAAALGDGRASPEQSVELAWLLSLMRTDTARALELLQGVLQRTDPEARAWQRPAWLLKSLLSEQRRLEEQLDRLNTQLRDHQRDNQRRIDQLQEKLEALKSIERSLNQRGAPPAAPARP